MEPIRSCLIDENANEIEDWVEKVLVIMNFFMFEQFHIEYFEILVEVNDPAVVILSNVFEVIKQKFQLCLLFSFLFVPDHLILLK